MNVTTGTLESPPRLSEGVPEAAPDPRFAPRPPVHARLAPPTTATTPAPPAAPTQTLPPPTVSAGPWTLPRYVVKERRLTFGRQYMVLDPQERMMAYCKQKVFRLKEDIRFFADRERTRELFRMQARKIMDFQANVDIVDSATGAVLASVRRKGWKSLVKDEWLLFNAAGTQIGVLHEEGTLAAFFRRWGDTFATLFPARYTLHLGPAGAEREAAQVKERFQFWGDTYDIHVTAGAPIDHRVLIGLVVLTDAMGVGGKSN